MNLKGLKSGAGFTLIELLVVIAIIGLLSTLAVISLGNARSKARDARRTSDLKAISSALDLYLADNATFGGVPGTWVALGSALTTYLPAGLPTDPTSSGSYIYNICLNSDTEEYLLETTLENNPDSTAVTSISGWLLGNCINQENNHVAPSCNTTVEFCLGTAVRS